VDAVTLLQLIVGTVPVLTGGTLLIIDRARQQPRTTATAVGCLIAGFVILGATPPTT
jgi:hypothetical protein